MGEQIEGLTNGYKPIATMRAGEFYFSPFAGLPLEQDALSEAITALIAMEVPGIEWWMAPRRTFN
jgi:hypothetical protein